MTPAATRHPRKPLLLEIAVSVLKNRLPGLSAELEVKGEVVVNHQLFPERFVEHPQVANVAPRKLRTHGATA